MKLYTFYWLYHVQYGYGWEMDVVQQEKKDILIKEISFWKINKLLPEHYCDFLLTLYTGGDEQLTEQNEAPKRMIRKDTLFTLLGAFIAILIIVAMYVLSTKYIAIPIAISVAAIVVILYVTFRKTTGQMMRALTYAVAALLLLALSVRMTTLFAANNDWALYSILIANCVVWLISGTKMKLLFFTISGYLGLVVIIMFGFFL